ncbi:hypothetical protein Q3G72_005307 [Acer saccharum]|nr:hypothetical protein Q3G72_005307 [Acer saccharum]
MLIKLNADPSTRAEIMWLVDIFRAKVVDTAEHLLTVEVTGDPGKMVAVLRNFSKFGINISVNANDSTSSRCDVYPVEPYDDFPVNQVLDAYWGVLYNEDSSGVRSHTLSMLVNNTPGVLNIVTGVISRRSYSESSCGACREGGSFSHNHCCSWE